MAGSDADEDVDSGAVALTTSTRRNVYAATISGVALGRSRGLRFIERAHQGAARSARTCMKSLTDFGGRPLHWRCVGKAGEGYEWGLLDEGVGVG